MNDKLASFERFENRSFFIIMFRLKHIVKQEIMRKTQEFSIQKHFEWFSVTTGCLMGIVVSSNSRIGICTSINILS